MPRKKVSDTSVNVVEMTEEKSDQVVISTVLSFTLPKSTMDTVRSDKEAVLLARAKEQWMNEVGSLRLSDVTVKGL